MYRIHPANKLHKKSSTEKQACIQNRVCSPRDNSTFTSTVHQHTDLLAEPAPWPVCAVPMCCCCHTLPCTPPAGVAASAAAALAGPQCKACTGTVLGSAFGPGCAFGSVTVSTPLSRLALTSDSHTLTGRPKEREKEIALLHATSCGRGSGRGQSRGKELCVSVGCRFYLAAADLAVFDQLTCCTYAGNATSKLSLALLVPKLG
jgi:hypothetical protein